MTRKYVLNRCLQFGLASFLSCGTVSILTVKTLAQQSNIVPDNTLGSESSQVISNFQGQSIERITGGATRGINLFHSFKEFNISADRAAYFFNSNAAIENILARVTGGKESEILGKLGTDSSKSVNLFLMNPNGIVFGKDASLDVQGSFVGTTANGLAFGNQGVFSATTPTTPGLLTINPSALFFNQINQNAAIENNSVASAGTDPAGFNALGLRVPDGKSLLLVGGNVSMDGGRLNAYGGRVELGGLGEPGIVALGVNGDNLSLRFPDNVARGSVSLTNQAGIYVEGTGDGNIAVNAKDIEILGRTVLSAGIGRGLGTPETVAGDITLNATGEINIAGGSRVDNQVRLGSKGNGGNITIDSGSFSLSDGARLSALTRGQGNAGNVTVSAKDAISLAYAPIFSTVEAGGVGKGGNISINAAKVSLTDGAQLLTSTREASDTQPPGRGDAGNVNVKVTGAVDIAGKKNRLSSGIRSNMETGTVGNGGNINIDSGSFLLRDGAQLSASTRGQGNGGDVTVRALDAVSLAGAGIFSTVEVGGVGKGGNIDINAAKVSLSNDSRLAASTLGQGDAGNVTVQALDAVSLAGADILSTVSADGVGKGGNIDINAAKVSLSNNSQLAASTFGQGDAGNVKIRASGAITFDRASAFSTVEDGSVGNGGEIDVTTGSLSLTNSATFNAITYGQGKAGNVRIRASGAITFDGGNEGAVSSVGSSVGRTGIGDGGDIDIQSSSLSLTNGGELIAGVFQGGQGNSGNITVNVKNSINISGVNTNGGPSSGLFTDPEDNSKGQGGNILLSADALKISDGGILSARTRNAFRGGNITVNVNSLDLTGGGQILTAAFDKGNAGDIILNATKGITISGSDPTFDARLAQFGRPIVDPVNSLSGLFANTDVNSTGQGGNITIRTGQLQVQDRAQVTVSSDGVGVAGKLGITANTVRLNNGSITAQTRFGNGGDLTLDVKDLLILRNNSQISTTAGNAASGGDGGNININSKYIIAIPKENSDISANAYSGNGGKVEIVSKGIFGIEARPELTQKSDITASSQRGISGVININAPDTSTIQNGLLELPTYAIDTNALIANSCISRGTKRQENSFTITGSGALPNNRPSDAFVSNYTTGEVRGVEATSRPWKKGDPIIEPQGVYRLNNGELLLSRECSN